MKKRLLSFALIACLSASMAVTAYGETLRGDPGWGVSFTKDNKMVSNFKTTDVDEAVYGMQPGDNVIITLSLKNENTAATDWYMTNKVLRSLEESNDNTAAGGAYTYILAYTDKKGEEKTLFSSDTVGGENISKAGEGLHAATDALEDFFYLDTLDPGDKGKVTLEVALDGETQGNDYQDTLADLQMNFAVELGTPRTVPSPGGTGTPAPGTGTGTPVPRTPTPGTPGSRTGTVPTSVVQRTTERLDDGRTPTAVVQTGDETQLEPYILAACISGGVFLSLAVYGTVRRRKEERRQ